MAAMAFEFVREVLSILNGNYVETQIILLDSAYDALINFGLKVIWFIRIILDVVKNSSIWLEVELECQRLFFNYFSKLFIDISLNFLLVAVAKRLAIGGYNSAVFINGHLTRELFDIISFSLEFQLGSLALNGILLSRFWRAFDYV